ncbi:MAG: molybdopterin converting factor subunit 1 [Chloroflexi bacterium B3_Chlor]|nr:MAG: molybdopterin converting factor subunit 1 [Chloroflexi bacterium B3_Chlor]
MRVKVRLFGAPREALGKREIQQDLPSGSTVQDLMDLLMEEYPALRSHSSMIRMALNRKYVLLEAQLREGDEVAFIPPVGGG